MDMRLSTVSLIGLALLWIAPPAAAQFNSGSNGSDGALNIPSGSGNVVFDPVALGIDADGDNVFHFTTITIGSSSKLILRASKLRNRAVVFLAQGDVTFGSGGGVTLDGDDPAPNSSPVQIYRAPAQPGPGGYPGGLGSRTDTPMFTPASDGFGPQGAGGVAGTSGCPSTVSAAQHASSNHMSVSMIPLVGGAGGAGAYCATAGTIGRNGGAGGGAIRIVSTTRIVLVSGSFLSAIGGRDPSNYILSGAGGGGMIHLIAPEVTVPSGAYLYAYSHYGINQNYSPLAFGNGVIRLNGNTVLHTGSIVPNVIVGGLYSLPLPSGQPEVRITQVNGVDVAFPTSGQLSGADAVINTASAATVTLAAKNIPVGTVVSLRISSELVQDQSVPCSALSGTLANSTATCTATFPLGANITIAAASW